MSNPLTILHLSDLQFGRNHRYPDGQRSLDCLFEKLAADLEALSAEADLRPAVIVVSGDVAEWSLPAEYAAAQGFLEKLTAKLAIPRQQVVIVPGNHDVNRKLCEGPRLMAEGGGEPFEEPFFAKFNDASNWIPTDRGCGSRSCTITSSAPAIWTTRICATAMRSWRGRKKAASRWSCTGTDISRAEAVRTPSRSAAAHPGHRQRGAGPRHAARCEAFDWLTGGLCRVQSERIAGNGGSHAG